MEGEISVFYDLIYRLAQFEYNSELNHIILCQELLFQPEVVFYRLDQRDRKCISANEILDFLQDNKKQTESPQSLFNFIASHDRDMDGVLNYFEFLNYILPKTQPVLQQIVLARDSYFIKKKMFLPEVIEQKLSEVLYFDIVGLEMIEKMRTIIMKNTKLTPHKLFDLIDSDRLKYFTIGQFDLFLQKHGVNLHVYELFIFFNSADTNEDGKIDYDEFVAYIFGPNRVKNQKTSKYSTPEKTSEEDVYEDLKQVFPTQKIPPFKVHYQQLLRLCEEQMLLNSIFKQLKENSGPQQLETAYRAINKGQPISLQDLYAYTNDNGLITFADLERLFQKHDLDEDGLLNQDEFNSIFEGKKSQMVDEQPRFLTRILKMKIMMGKGQGQIDQLVNQIKRFDPNFINDMAPLIKDINVKQRNENI